MAIKIECGDCGKTYNVKDEMDGKKIRCKECSAVIVVRAEDERGDTDEAEYEPPVQKSANKKKSRRRSSSGELPVPIIIAMTCLMMMVGMTLYEFRLIGRMPRGWPIPWPVLIICLGWFLMRSLIPVRVWFGLYNGTASTRYTSIVLAVMASLYFGLALTMGPPQNVPSTYVVYLYVSLCLRLVFISCMLTPSAGDYMRR